MHIEVTREAEDRLSRQRWSFTLQEKPNALAIRLTSYRSEVRETRRHKNWLAIERWSFWSTREFRSILAKDVPLPRGVMDEAKQSVVDRITVIPPTLE